MEYIYINKLKMLGVIYCSSKRLHNPNVILFYKLIPPYSLSRQTWGDEDHDTLPPRHIKPLTASFQTAAHFAPPGGVARSEQDAIHLLPHARTLRHSRSTTSLKKNFFPQHKLLHHQWACQWFGMIVEHGNNRSNRKG